MLPRMRKLLSLKASSAEAKVLRAVSSAIRRDPTVAARVISAIAQDDGVGPFRSERHAITVIRDCLVAQLAPQAIWLTGSRARGAAKTDSDFDIIVVFPDDRPCDGDDRSKARRPVAGLGIDVDVIPCLASEFEDEKHKPDTIIGQAFERGIRLYPFGSSRPRASR